MNSQKVFEKLQARWKTAHEKASTTQWELNHKYGTWYVYAPRSQQEKMERARAAEEKAAEAIFAWLDAHSPRSWRTGCPAHWICETLSYADAITSGRLSVIPPCCYGSNPSDMLRFASAV